MSETEEELRQELKKKNKQIEDGIKRLDHSFSIIEGQNESLAKWRLTCSKQQKILDEIHKEAREWREKYTDVVIKSKKP